MNTSIFFLSLSPSNSVCGDSEEECGYLKFSFYIMNKHLFTYVFSGARSTASIRYVTIQERNNYFSLNLCFILHVWFFLYIFFVARSTASIPYVTIRENSEVLSQTFGFILHIRFDSYIFFGAHSTASILYGTIQNRDRYFC